MKTSKLIMVSIASLVSLGVYTLETLIPPVLPIPGVKLGLANAITLISMYILGNKCAFGALIIRILISSLLFGQPISMLFSISGGLISFGVMYFLKRIMDEKNIWALSVFGAFGHNIGQIIMAVIITREIAVMYYFLFLVISSVVTGVFTGLTAQFTISRLKIIKLYK